ncbi:MAG: histidine phosphatase family protein [Bradyrhizobium sp.]|uniref:histidine phosphatase family protein n=1 Tax=Bradyrhizobium sp. TaxID=376 RepID=UPI001D249830|nr:histidine phosphatase family protein [Bradyrhizobium sp.]MBV9563546.1 histidine phosphatase family protein [Bradyrhizobium sp.]
MARPVLYYIRHGETEWNALGRLQGTRDIPLNEVGHRQAVHAGGVLQDLLAHDGRDKSALPFVASPLGRARMTMELVRETLRLPPRDYVVDDRLREIGYGQWEGSTLAEAEARDPELYARRLVDKWRVGAPDGESYADVEVRVSEWYAGLAADTVAVAHGGVARALMVARGFESATSVVDLYIEQGTVYVFGENGLTKHS